MNDVHEHTSDVNQADAGEHKNEQTNTTEDNNTVQSTSIQASESIQHDANNQLLKPENQGLEHPNCEECKMEL